MAKNGELRFEPQQVALGCSVELALLRRGIATIAFGDMTADGQCRDGDGISSCLRLASRALSYDAQDFAAEGDRFLPDFEISYAAGHGEKMPTVARQRGTNCSLAVPTEREGQDIAVRSG